MACKATPATAQSPSDGIPRPAVCSVQAQQRDADAAPQRCASSGAASVCRFALHSASDFALSKLLRIQSSGSCEEDTTRVRFCNTSPTAKLAS